MLQRHIFKIKMYLKYVKFIFKITNNLKIDLDQN